LKKYSSRQGDADREERRSDRPVTEHKDDPQRERRASYRVKDEQQSGQGSLSAMSKMKMLERKRAAIRPAHDEPPRLLD
jgi:hypothetical protein